MVRKPAAGAPRAGTGGGSRVMSRLAFQEGLGAGVPRVILLLGGDPLVADELAGLLEALPEFADPFGSGGALQAAGLKLIDIATRVEELPLLASGRVLVIKGAESLLKNPPAELTRIFPPPGSATVLVLVAVDEDVKPARKTASGWAEVLPGHAVRVSVGAPTREDALRWGRLAACGAGVEIADSVWEKAHARSSGDGARIRTDIELAVLAALSGGVAEAVVQPRQGTLEEAAAALHRAVIERDARKAWILAEEFRSRGGLMDARGAEWVRAAAESAAKGGTVDLLRILAGLQLNWRRNTGAARQVMEHSALELALAGRLHLPGDRS